MIRGDEGNELVAESRLSKGDGGFVGLLSCCGRGRSRDSVCGVVETRSGRGGYREASVGGRVRMRGSV